MARTPNMKGVINYLNELIRKDEPSFRNLINTRFFSDKADMTYSLLRVLNDLFSDDNIHIAIIKNNETGVIEKAMIIDKETYDKMVPDEEKK